MFRGSWSQLRTLAQLTYTRAFFISIVLFDTRQPIADERYADGAVESYWRSSSTRGAAPWQTLLAGAQGKDGAPGCGVEHRDIRSTDTEPLRCQTKRRVDDALNRCTP
jgi:hypothetical protein